MKIIYILLLSSLLFLGGCSQHYVQAPNPLFIQDNSITLINDPLDERQFRNDLKKLVIEVVSIELEKQGIPYMRTIIPLSIEVYKKHFK